MAAMTLGATAPTAAAIDSTGDPAHVAAIDPAVHVRPVDSTTIDLPAPPVVGQRAAVAVTVDTQIAGASSSGPLSLDVGVAREVTGIDAATGAFSTRSVIADVALGQVPVGLDVSALESARSLEIVQHFDANGAALGPSEAERAASPEQAAGGRQVIDLLAATTLGYPADPVAVGASWVSPGTAADSSGLSIPVTYHCRLVGVDGATFTVEVSFAEDFHAAGSRYGDVAGTVSGQGRLHGSLVNVLVMDGSISQTVDGVATVDGAPSPLALTSTIQIASG